MLSFCTGAYPCLSKLNVSLKYRGGVSGWVSCCTDRHRAIIPQIEEDLCLAWFHVVAQAKSYHLVYIWGSLVKFQGGRVVLKTMLCARVRIC